MPQPPSFRDALVDEALFICDQLFDSKLPLLNRSIGSLAESILDLALLIFHPHNKPVIRPDQFVTQCATFWKQQEKQLFRPAREMSKIG